MNAVINNPYRTLGLFGNSREKELQRQLSKLKAYTSTGKEVCFDYDFPFFGNIVRNPERVQEAASKIEQSKNKVHFALFWFLNSGHLDEAALNNLKEGHIEKATEIWEKTIKDDVVTAKNFSSISNLSTLQLGIVTFNGSFDPGKFTYSIELKGKLLLSDVFNSFVSTVIGESITINNDAVLKEFADEILQIVKPYLNKSNGLKTSQLINAFNSFPNEIRQYVSNKFTDRPLSNIENQIEKTKQKRGESPRNAEQYGEELYKNAKEDLVFLKNTWGTNNIQYQMIADKAANEILQCSIDFFNKNQDIDADNNYHEKAMKLAKLANEIAVSSRAKDRIKENINTLEEMKDREILQAIALLQSVKDAYETNKAQVNAQVRVQERSLRFGQFIDWGKVEEVIENSINWNNVIDLIKQVIPQRAIDKISKCKNVGKIKEYRILVNFLMSRLKSFLKVKVEYLNQLTVIEKIEQDLKNEEQKLESIKRTPPFSSEIKSAESQLANIKNTIFYSSEINNANYRMNEIQGFHLFRSRTERERQITEQQKIISDLQKKSNAEKQRQTVEQEQKIYALRQKSATEQQRQILNQQKIVDNLKIQYQDAKK